MNEQERKQQWEVLKKWIGDNWGYPHNQSDEKAKELKTEDWGLPEDVEKMAIMLRKKQNQKGTKAILEQLKQKGELHNKKDKKLKPTLSDDSIGKLLSGDWEVAGNVDQLFENAIEPWKFRLNPDKDNSALNERKYLFSPMKYNGKTVPVKLTVKEYKKPKDGTRLYSGKIIDHDLGQKNQGAGLKYEGDDNQTVQASTARHPVFDNIPHTSPDVKNLRDLYFHRNNPMSRV